MAHGVRHVAQSWSGAMSHGAIAQHFSVFCVLLLLLVTTACMARLAGCLVDFILLFYYILFWLSPTPSQLNTNPQSLCLAYKHLTRPGVRMVLGLCRAAMFQPHGE